MTPLAGHPAVAAGVSWVLTYLVHSTVLLGGAALLTRFALRRDGWRDAIWKAALVGGLVTATVQVAVGYRPLVGRIEIAGIDGAAPRMSAPGGIRGDIAGAPAGVDAAGPASAERAGSGDDIGGGAAGADADDPAGRTATDESRDAAAAAASGEGTPDRGSAGPDRAGAGDAGSVRAGGAGLAPAGEAGSDEAGDAGSALAGDGGHGGVLARARSRSAWLLLGLWASIAFLLLLRLVVRQRRVHRLLNDRRQVEEGGLPGMLAELRRNAGLWRPVWLASSPRCPSPLALGTREICVPERFITELEPEAQRGALAHELAHIARRDPVWHLVAGVIESVLFFQPLNRLARLRLRETAEYLCDDWAVRQTGSELGLARCLAAVASWVAPGGEAIPSGTMAMAEGGSPLLTRVERLLDHGPGAAGPSPVARGLVAAVLVLAVAGSAPAVTPAGPSGGSRMDGGAAPAGADDAGSAEEPTGAAGDPRPSIDRPRQDGVPTALDAGDERTAARTEPDAEPPPPEGTNGVRRERTVAGSSADRVVGGTAGSDTVRVIRAPDRTLPFGVLWSWAEGAASDAGDRTYWIAYATASLAPAGRMATSDSESWEMSELAGTPLRTLLGVEDELERAVPDGSAVVLLFRMRDPRTGSVGLERIALRSAAVGMRLDAPVYWLGALPSEVSFVWLRDLYDGLPGTRLPATLIDAIAVHPGPDVGPYLREVIGDTAPDEVRAEAVEGLEWHPSDETLALLARLGREDASEEVRHEAAEALGELDHPAAVDTLLDLTRTGRDDGVRREAVESLGERQTPDVADILLEIALNAPDPDIGREAAESLAELSADLSVPALRRVAREASHGTVRRQAAESLGDVGTPEAMTALDEIVERHDDADVVFQAVEAIGEFPAELALPRLERIARAQRLRGARREALEQLAEFESPEVADALVEVALNDLDGDIAREATESLGEMASDWTVPGLRQIAFGAASDDARRQAAEALGDVGTSEALAVLDEIVERHDRKEVVFEAVEAIAEFIPSLALPRLERIARTHRMRDVRREALDEISDVGPGGDDLDASFGPDTVDVGSASGTRPRPTRGSSPPSGHRPNDRL